MTAAWILDRLERAARDGEVIKLTGPRSVSDPGPCRDCADSGHPNGFCCCDTAGCTHNWNDNAAGGRN